MTYNNPRVRAHEARSRVGCVRYREEEKAAVVLVPYRKFEINKKEFFQLRRSQRRGQINGYKL